MADEKRKMSERSLENLKLGAESRRQGKVRCNFTILPETIQWLKCSGNASSAIDNLVFAALNQKLFSKNIHDRKEELSTVSNDVYERKIQELEQSLEETYQELSKMRSLLEESRKKELALTNQLSNCSFDMA